MSLGSCLSWVHFDGDMRKSSGFGQPFTIICGRSITFRADRYNGGVMTRTQLPDMQVGDLVSGFLDDRPDFC